MNAYFDFHFHPLFKQYLVEFDDEKRKRNPWQQPIRLPLLGKIADAFAGQILESQCCVRDSLSGGIQLGVANLVALEHAMGNNSFLFKLLEQDAVTPLDERYFRYVRESQGSYHDLMEKELNYYRWAGDPQTPEQINIISRKKGKLENQLQKNKLNVVLALEGGHNLSRRKINELVGIQDPQEVIGSIRKMKDLDFLYLTLTHLTHIREQPLSSHAFGFKLINHPEAKPQVTGLTELGKQVVKACMDTSQIGSHPILIDIKHMSLVSRLDLYRYRREMLRPGSGFTTGEKGWPLLATHVGVTGYNMASLESHMAEFGSEGLSVRLRTRRQRAGDIGKQESVYFNSWTINLLDDDIREIARSGGLIGISLDARILGFEGIVKRLKNKVKEEFAYDYMSKGDFTRLFPEKALTMPRVAPISEEELTPSPTESLVTEELFGLASRKEREMYLFCLNVLHVVAVINQMGKVQGTELAARGLDTKPLNGWDFVAIGSDFDGLIDSLKVCRKISDLADFEEKLMDYFPKAEKAYREVRPETPDLLLRKNNQFDAQTFRTKALRRLLYENGKDFVQWWFS
jgi:microsomal dipeptidase-like Zn-dependent dipeptidase